jgi:hypothetical protein
MAGDEKGRAQRFYVTKADQSDNSIRGKSVLWGKRFHITGRGMEAEHNFVEEAIDAR